MNTLYQVMYIDPKTEKTQSCLFARNYGGRVYHRHYAGHSEARDRMSELLGKGLCAWIKKHETDLDLKTFEFRYSCP